MVEDTVAPVLALNGSDPQIVPAGTAYVEAGVTITDVETGLTATIDAPSLASLTVPVTTPLS